MDYRILNVRLHTGWVVVVVVGEGRGGTDTVRESALKVDSGSKILCRYGKSSLPQRRAGPTLCQLKYIPTPLKYK